MRAAEAFEGKHESTQRTRTTVLRFPEGLIGFGECRNFVLIEEEDISPFRRLQSTDRVDVGFFVLDPEYVRRNFLSLVSESDWESVGLADPDAKRVLVICRLGSTLAQSTGNLQAPLIVNDATRTGRQVILGNEYISCRQPLFQSVRRNNGYPSV